MAIENNIPNQIMIPGSLTGRHEVSSTSPINFLSTTTNMKSDIPTMAFASFNTNMKSDVPTPSAISFTSNMKSVFAINIKPLSGRHEISNTAPVNSILGANNELSSTAPQTSTLTGRFDASSIAPFISQLSGRFESSNIDSSLTSPGGRHESSDIGDSITAQTGRHESSDVSDSATTQTGRHESSDVGDSITTQTGRHETSTIDDSLTSADGRFTDSSVDDTPTSADGRFTDSSVDDTPTSPDGRFTDSSVDDTPTSPDGRFTDSAIDDTPTSPDGRFTDSSIDTTSGVNFLADKYATGFTVNQVPDGDFTSAAIGFSTYPGAPTPGIPDGRHLSSIIDDTTGVNFLDIPNAAATGFTIQAQKYNTQFIGAVDDIYNYPDPNGIGAGLVDTQITNGVNFLDLENLDATGFTPSQPYMHSQFKGVSGQGPKPTYDYPDTHGLGFGILSNALFSAENTPYTTVLKPDGFSKDRGDELEVSLFSKNSFDGGGILGASTEFKHEVFGGVQGQVPIMGNNPTGLGEFTEGGKTSGDIGIVNAFDDTTSGAKGFTPQMFDLSAPKTQFNGVAGVIGSLTYAYPTDVGPAGVGRLMYDVPFSDAGNPYGGEYSAALTKQLPVNPSIDINKGAGTELANFNLYKGAPDRLHFHEGNKYYDSVTSFSADTELNGMHPRSILADFAAREHSPSPLDSMKVLIPGNTGPSGESTDIANYTHVAGYPNYNTQNLSYGDAQVANQREGFVRNELFVRTIDYDTDGTYGHDLTFGGTGDDPKGLKAFTEPHIIRPMGKKWNGFSNEGTPFDEGAFRGGFLTLANRALLDVVRNTKHIIEDPIKGLLWGLKQIGLQASNPKVETEMAFLGRRTRVFNLGIGLLVNMLTGPFGIKLYRHGLLNGIGEGDSSYEAAVKAHGGINPYDPDRAEFGPMTVGKGGANRLALLKDELHFGESGAGAGGFLGLGNLLGFDGQKIELLSDTLLGGPKSLYGLGGTTIRRYYNAGKHTTGGALEQNEIDTMGGGRSSLLAKYSSLSHLGLAIAADDREGFEGIAKDFRDEIREGSGIEGDILHMAEHNNLNNFEENSLDAKFGYTAYNAQRDRRDTEDYFDLGDPFNELNDFEEETADGYNSQDSGEFGDNDMRDMIKFEVQDIFTGKRCRMRSYLTDMTDTITPNWQVQNYVGRPDGVHHYESTIRSFTFTLKVAAMSRQDMQGMYKKVNFIYGLAYPHVGSFEQGATEQTMVSPYCRLTVGDWLYNSPGYFKSVSTTIDNDYPWEINLESATDVAQLPHILSINIEFAVIGDGPHTSAVSSKTAETVTGLHIGGHRPGETEREFYQGLKIANE